MKIRISLLFAGLVILSLVAGGCTDILAKQKVGGFGDTTGTNNGGLQSTTSPAAAGTGESLRAANFYSMCYKNCVTLGKEPEADCDKACCVAACQPKTEEDAKRCAATCGYDLDKPEKPAGRSG